MRKRHELENIVLGNAAGFVKTEAEAEKFLRSAATRITVGSITTHPRTGNIGETYYYDQATGTSYNSLGMPNPGIEATSSWLPRFKERCKSAGKELCVSVAGFSPDEYAELVGRVAPDVDVIELNTGCGNIWGTAGQKPVPAQHPELFKAVLRAVQRVPGDLRIGVKLSRVPFDTMQEINHHINNSYCVSEVVQGNTKTNQRGKRPDGSEALAFRESEGAELKHEGGMGGRALFTEGLEQVALLAADLREDIKIIACGGIEDGKSLLRYLDRGADGALIGTACGEEGPRIFSRVFEEAANGSGDSD